MQTLGGGEGLHLYGGRGPKGRQRADYQSLVLVCTIKSNAIAMDWKPDSDEGLPTCLLECSPTIKSNAIAMDWKLDSDEGLPTCFKRSPENKTAGQNSRLQLCMQVGKCALYLSKHSWLNLPDAAALNYQMQQDLYNKKLQLQLDRIYKCSWSYFTCAAGLNLQMQLEEEVLWKQHSQLVRCGHNAERRNYRKVLIRMLTIIRVKSSLQKTANPACLIAQAGTRTSVTFTQQDINTRAQA